MEKIYQRLEKNEELFRKSFNHLCQAKSPAELARSFFNILNENLLLRHGAIFFREKRSTGWQTLFSTDTTDSGLTDLLREEKYNQVVAIDHPQFQLSLIRVLGSKAEFGMLLGKKESGSEFDTLDQITLQLLLHQLDMAYQFDVSRKKEKQLIFDLNHRVLQLTSLIDTSIEISRLQEGQRLLNMALERVLALTNAAKGMLRIKEGSRVLEKIFYPSPFRSRELERGDKAISTAFSFAGKVYSFYLFEKESREGHVRFDATDQLLLDAFARQVHVSLDNRYLYEQSLEKERIDSEISLAGTIQKKLIPEELPKIDGYDQYGINIPTKFIGGDYYDCIPLNDGRYMFIIADVSGKGVAAGLLVSTLHASVHAYLDSPFELETLIQRLNEVIHDAATEDKYITAAFVVLDPQSGEIQAVNAGHNPTYIRRRDKIIEELRIGGIPLGAMGFKFPYQSSKIRLNPGDSVFFYTDGVTEAMNEQGQEYDLERPVKNFLIAHETSTAKDFIEQLLTDLNKFTGETPQSDDITAMYLIKKSES